MTDYAGLPPDSVELDVAAGVRVVVVSDLHLTDEATPASSAAADQLAATLRDWQGDGVVVLAGDVVELLCTGPVEVSAVLGAYPELTAAARAFAAGDGHDLVYLIGNHDSRLAWDEDAAAQVADHLGARLALTADLRLETAMGWRRVRVEHGHRFDSANAFEDPRDPRDTPLGHHVAAELVPPLRAKGTAWLSGVDRLNEPTALPRMLASRLFYRRLAPWLWLLLLPPAVSLALALPWLDGVLGHSPWRRTVLIESGLLLALGGLTAAVGILIDRAWSSVTSSLSQRGWAQNDRAREATRSLAAEGYAGLVVGHTHHAELTAVGEAFYANAGCCTEVVEERATRRGFPPVYAAHRQLSWVELEGGADVSARLVHGRVDLAGTRLERLVSRPTSVPEGEPRVVASLADGAPWPTAPDPSRADRRARRLGAVALGAAGLLGVISALSPPLGDRLSLLREVVPLPVPEAAAALVAVASLALLLLARGVRRGQRQAWRLSVGLLLASAALHVVKGVDVEEALLALAAAGYLLAHQASFRGRPDRPSVRRGLLALSAGPVLTTAVGTAVVELLPSPGPRLALGRAFVGVAERLVGITDVALPSHAGQFLTPTLLAVGLGLAAFGLWLAFRPVISGRQSARDVDRARAIVRRYGRDTLAYFALRDDKEHFFHGESLVAYGLWNGICLVSPDPIGPRRERQAIWSAFRRFADDHGWTVALLGASEDWLPIYRAGGMREIYAGDEGIVDVQTFSMAGGRFKGLRQAVNRVANYGYRIEFHDPSRLEPGLQQALRDVMTHSRRGDVERGFSMTLGRVFDPEDRDLLLAVAIAPDGKPAAFAQFVPAPGIDGYSLDLMRRSDAEHPNGVTDFVVVKTIEHLRERGLKGLGLNFATMRAVLAGELGDGPTQRVQRWFLKKLSGSMQIESLWYYNAKFGTWWQPRYAVYDAPENIVPAALAVARAESWWELPVIGRFFVPKAADAEAVGAAAAAAVSAREAAVSSREAAVAAREAALAAREAAVAAAAGSAAAGPAANPSVPAAGETERSTTGA